MPEKTERSTEQVLKSHLEYRKQHNLEEDIAHNYSPDLVVMTEWGTFNGLDGIRHTASILHEQLPEARYDYKEVLCEKEFGFLKWAGLSKDYQTLDGADSYVVRDGKIVFQSIHYTVKPRNGH